MSNLPSFNPIKSKIDVDNDILFLSNLEYINVINLKVFNELDIATGDIGVDKEGINETNVHIKNSHKIHTPWVRLAYAYYLNHINSDTKDVFRGSSFGIEFEWFCHNSAYIYYSFKGDKMKANAAAEADIGPYIYCDNHEKWSPIMKKLYELLDPINSLNDFIKWISS